ARGIYLVPDVTRSPVKITISGSTELTRLMYFSILFLPVLLSAWMSLIWTIFRPFKAEGRFGDLKFIVLRFIDFVSM
ncbi:hypothetical protein JGI16_11247, partial [Candidatus Kryptonium thompsonii]